MDARGDRRGREILRYLLSHPDARDTAEGIFEWWLREPGSPPEQRQSALQRLCREGWLAADAVAGEQVYRLADGVWEKLEELMRDEEV